MSVSIVINTFGATPDAVARALESIGVAPPDHEVLLLGGDLEDPAWQRAIGPHKAHLRHVPAVGLSPSEGRNAAVAAGTKRLRSQPRQQSVAVARIADDQRFVFAA